jgi:hypothetical protein
VVRGAFDVETVGWYLSGRPVATRVHRITPGEAGVRELGEGVVGGQQVRVRGHQVSLRDTDCGLRTTLDSGS